MKVAIVTDKPRAKYLPTEEGLLEDKQKKKTVAELKQVLSKKYDCIDLVLDDNIVGKLRREKVDLVFNLCNGIQGESRISQLPAILEYAGIPYTSSSPLGHGLAYNKIYSCKIFKQSDISTPDFTYVYNIKELKNMNLKFPVLVKPKDEGSSRGIDEGSLVFDVSSLKSKVQKELRVYNPPIMLTEYIEGREFTVGVVGNGEDTSVLPILEIDFSKIPAHLSKFYSFEVKSHYADKTIYHVPARLDQNTKELIEKTAIKAYNSLGMRDYARVDFRLKDGVPYVLEVNSLPGLKRGHSDICKMAEACEIGYDGLILKIVESAMKRYLSHDELEDESV
ncbi:D-alanine--D-alanine ligase family protein [Sporanaerobacter acetigenes]|uniref:D-alanine--D-alanine ligase family protein n=1 Tax=Sporanaerobacter acetigenes TaxID=165813 RepID=UPI003328AAE8